MTSGARSDLLADLRSFAADLPGAPDMRGHADALQIVRPGQAATVMHGPPPGEMARTALQQIATAIQGNGERSFELLLNPAELGKVRISLSPGDGGMTISIVADRPESLDLLRRHAGLLADELRDIGYDDTAFSFGAESFGSGSRDGRPGAVPGGPDATQASTDLPEEAANAGDPDGPPARREPLSGRMDIRI